MKFLLMILLVVSSKAYAFGESGPGNGTDYVKILFSEAQLQLVQLSEPVTGESLKRSNMSSEFVEWLTAGESPRWPRLKYMFKKITLAYQEALCEDELGRKSTICFVLLDSGPTVLISVSGNKLTTKSQAMAMLVHEAGHFLNEMDHLFLNDLGVSLVQFLSTPRVLEFVKTNSETVANIFLEKDGCNQGTSNLALALIKEAKLELSKQCLLMSSVQSCEEAQFSYTLSGEAEWIEGRGYTQKVLCSIKALYLPKN